MNDSSNSAIILGVDHPALAAADVDALARWYCETLDYVNVFRDDKPVCILRASDRSLLEIMPKDDTPRPDRTTWTPGWSHLALRVTDLEQAMEVLEKRGVEWTSEIIAAIGGGRLRNFCDPEGNMLQIVERPPELLS